MEQQGANPVLAPKAADGPASVESVTARQRKLALTLVNLSHLLNHIQSGMVAVLYPVIMNELGLSYFQVGLLQTFHQLAAQGFQVIYGFAVRFLPRAVLLGIGNLLVGVFGLGMGFSQNFTHLAMARTLAGTGSSAQHPLGSAILVSYFAKVRGRALTLHHSAGSLGGLIAPALVSLSYLAGMLLVRFTRMARGGQGIGG